jgi:hypothetical protein
MTSLEGRIDITLTTRGGRIAGVEIDSSRPQLAQRMMAGHTPDEGVQLAGLVFSLCGRAQAIAADAGGTVEAAEQSGRERRVLAELTREHAWRLLLDWPEQAGHVADLEALLHLRQGSEDAEGLARAISEVLTERLLGEPPETWLGRSPEAFADWCHAGRSQTAGLFSEWLEGVGDGPKPAAATNPLLPPLHRLEDDEVADLAHKALDTPDFCARPVWRGRPAETGALSRMRDDSLVAAWTMAHGRGAGARMLARLVELARLPDRLRRGGPAVVRYWPLGRGAGVAGVETSRGLLLHIVRLADGRVDQYRILAPTEWNFHPEGALSEAMAGLPADDGLEARARMVAQALDPCVEYGVHIRHA